MVFKILPKFQSFHLSHKTPEVFCMSQWQKKTKSLIFLAYRILLASLFIGILSYAMTYSIVVKSDFDFWFIYLTNNGIILCTITTTYAAFLVVFFHFNWINLESNSINYKIYWFLSNVATVLAFMISIVYWALLFEWNLYYNGEVELTLIDLLVHGVNSIAMLIELFVVLHPMYFLHFVYSISIGGIYLIFTLIYHAAGGTDKEGNKYIYKILNWKNPGTTGIIVVGIAILIILLHTTACLIQIGRVKLHKFATKNQQVYSLTT